MGKVGVRELLLYKSHISNEEVRNFIKQLTKPKLPFLGLFDLSWIFSRSPNFIVQRMGNTIKFYFRKDNRLKNVAHFLFPFRLGKSKEIELEEARWWPPPSLAIAGDNLLEFMIKGDFVELRFNITRFLGKNIVKGVAITEQGGRVFFIGSATRFLSFDLEKHPSIYIELVEPMPKTMSFKSKRPIFEDEDRNTIGLENFDPIQHTLVIGESGSGKSVFLMIYLRALQETYGKNVQMVVIDPHGEFKDKYPGEKHVVDYINEYIEPLSIEGDYSPMMAQLITQLIMGSIGEENKYAERVVFHAVHLLGSIGKLNLRNLHDLLVDEAKRMEFVSEAVEAEEARAFFDTEFPNIYIHHFNDAILPIVNFISEYNLYIGKAKKKVSLRELLEKHNMVVISFDPNAFGKRIIKFFGSAIINQMYILAITGKLKKKTLLVVDEVARVENPIIKDILAETRKFNLFLILATQYLGQLRKEVLNAIISNMRNIIAFKLHKKDAELLAGMMEIKMEDYFKKVLSANELEEKKKDIFIRLDQREAVVRLFDGTRYLIPIKVRTVDRDRWLDNSNP